MPLFQKCNFRKCFKFYLLIVLVPIVAFMTFPIGSAIGQSNGTGPNITSLLLQVPTPIEKNSKFEISFAISETTATNFYFPYEKNPPAGIQPGVGITVDALFLPPGQSDWSYAKIVPCFYYQPIEERGTGSSLSLLPVGQADWRVRFTPQSAGVWQIKIKAADAGGTVETNPYQFTVVDSARKGFLRVSSLDSRFFAFDDGTPFVTPLTNLEQGSPFNTLTGIRQVIPRLGDNGIRFVRWFPNGEGANYAIAPYSDSIRINWRFGQSGVTREDADTARGKAFSFSPYYYSGQNIPALPGAKYRLKFWAKVAGDQILRAEIGSLSRADIGSSTSAFHETNGRGDLCTYKKEGWNEYILEVTNMNLTQMEIGLRGLYVSTDAPAPYNTVKNGSIRIHSLSLQRDESGSGGWGGNLLLRSDPDTFNYVDQRCAAGLDEIFKLSEDYGVYHKLTLFHKNDELLNQLQYDGSIGSDWGQYNEHFYKSPVAVWYEHAYVRYFVGRWSYSTALHSLELGNENHLTQDSYDAGFRIAEAVHSLSPRRILMTNSFWGWFVADFFNRMVKYVPA